MILVKLLILLLVPVLLILPFLPIRWIFSFSYYAAPNVTRRRNLINILLMAALALACAILMPELRKLAVWVGSLKPVVWVLSRIPVYAQYAAELAIIIFVNFLYCFAAFLILLIVRRKRTAGTEKDEDI